MLFRVIILFLICFGLAGWLLNQAYAYVASQETTIATSCSIEDEGYVTSGDLVNFEKRTLKLPILSTEGNEVRVYENSTTIIAISFGIYGETGRIEYNYYFNTVQTGKILVEIINYNYTLPVFAHDTELGSPFRKNIATETKTKLVICEDYPVNHMGGDHLENARANAIEYLNLIRKNL